ncbi:hypothetical protein ACV3OC_14090 [Clostridium perfringens]
MKKNFYKIFILILIAGSILLSSKINVYAWDGKVDGTGTHAMIVEQALKIIENDLSDDEPDVVRINLEILKKNLNELKLGSTYPDYDKNAYDLYQDHFGDPDTENNF